MTNQQQVADGKTTKKASSKTKKAAKASVSYQSPIPHLTHELILCGDARRIPLPNNSVDVVITSPPYWRKRDYEIEGQLGQEEKVGDYVANLMTALDEWRRVLRPTGSVFLNVGDTYWNKSLAGVPARIEVAARDNGWIVRNRIIWAKDNGMPEPAQDRLANRHEFIFHLVVSENYYYDMFGYSAQFGNGANPGDVWNVKLKPNKSSHLAPFPEEIVERAILLACPEEVCTKCGTPRRRIVRRTDKLNPERPQARRAMEIAKEYNLTAAHIAAIQATGISDAGKALKVQTGTGKNSDQVKELAAYAKEVLGGYFREFTFALKEHEGWTSCDCGVETVPGVVLDPFMGTGTTLRVATKMGRQAIGVDLNPVWS